MKKNFLIVLNIIVVVSMAMFMYHSYKAELDSNIHVDCNYNYLVTSNTMNLSCTVNDEDLIISNDNPLNVFVFDSNNVIIFEDYLINGNNDLQITGLEYNSLYTISIEGYDYIKEDYVLTKYDEFIFSTTRSDIVVPTFVFTEKSVTESEYNFSIDLIDIENNTESIDISLYDEDDNLLITQNYTEFNNLDFLFTDLNSEEIYSIIIAVNYIINDFNELNRLLETSIFTTLKTQLPPSVEISNVFNDNVNLSFNLATNNEDATGVIYTIELIDLEGNILYSEDESNSEINIEIDDISGNYYISVKSSYALNGSTYTNIELNTYYLYNNELANFFTLPSVAIVNTDLPLTNYDDYSDYVYTFLNSGASDFSIICEAPIDCAQLVTNDLYSDIPFIVSDLVHAYYDINTINYSYTSTQLNVVVEKEYTTNDMIIIDQKIDLILNSIISEPMSNYEKILSVHDYIVNNTVYDSTCFNDINLCDNDHTAIGVLFDQEAVCEGYAHAIDIMLRALHIPTVRISSDTHQWSAVYYNGGWHHLDATWDDPVTTNGDNVLLHTFFLISSAELVLEDSSSSHEYEHTFINFME